MTTLGWIANILIASGLWGVGNKRRGAFLLTIAGESLWIVKASCLGQWDLAAICLVFAVLAVRNWFAWQ